MRKLRHRAGSRRNKRNRDVGSRPSDSVVREDRRIGQLRPNVIRTLPPPSDLQLTVVPGITGRSPNVLGMVESLDDTADLAPGEHDTTRDLLGHLPWFLEFADAGTHTWLRDDPLSDSALRAKISREAKKQGVKVSLGLARKGHLSMTIGNRG